MDLFLLAIIIFVIFFVYFNTADDIEDKPIYNKFKEFSGDIVTAVRKLFL